jgi:hypothetical protein
MTIEPYSLVTDGRRTGAVMAMQGGLARVSWEPAKRVPLAWAELMRSIETTPLLDLRTIQPPRRLAA